MPSSNFNQQPPEPSNKKWLWILGGCGCLVVMAIIGTIGFGIFMAITIPRHDTPPNNMSNDTSNDTSNVSGSESGTMKKQYGRHAARIANDSLALLESSASIYEAEQQKAPTGFTDFVTLDAQKASAENSDDTKSGFTMDANTIGNREGEPCTIEPAKITCSGGHPSARFDELPGNVVFHFNQGKGTFSLTCEAGPNPPEGWNPAACAVEN
jgi:hypothetical protein